MQFNLPPPEIRGKGASTFTLEHIVRRLAKLREMELTEQVAAEIQFLQALKRKRFPSDGLLS